MKCARCDCDTTFPERSGGKCPRCGGLFAFEPRTGDLLSDMAWKQAIDWVGSNGTVRFTLGHLHHAVARRKKHPKSGLGLAFIVIGTIVTIAAAALGSGMGIGVGLCTLFLGIVFMVVRGRATPPLDLSRGEFEELYKRWVAAHGTTKGLIVPRPVTRALSQALKDEFESYSFDRAVICDTKETADLLLGNDFHFENNCAVLTASGYPDHAAPIIRKMLKQNPRLEVFVLHDATVEGCVLAHYLKTDPHWFARDEVRVFDVALRPAQAAATPNLRWDAEVEVPEHPALSADERRWLSSHRMHLAAISPEQTIKRLYRAIQSLPTEAKSQTFAADSAGDTSSSNVIIWTTDAHASDGGGDSFG